MKKIFLGVFLALASVVLVQVGCDPKATPASAVVPVAPSLAATKSNFNTTVNMPFGMCMDATGNLYVAEANNADIVKITKAGIKTVFANGFIGPRDVQLSPSGAFYVADEGPTGAGCCGPGGQVRKIVSGVVSTIPGSWAGPRSVAIDGSGNVYVADNWGNKIYKITSGGVVSTFAGTGTHGYNDNTSVSSATFYEPTGVAVTKDGSTVYVVDRRNYAIRKITGGMVTTLASPSFSWPEMASLDAQGNLYVTDNGNRLWKITPSGVTSVVISGFSCPMGVLVSGNLLAGGQIFVSDNCSTPNKIWSVTIPSF